MLSGEISTPQHLVQLKEMRVRKEASSQEEHVVTPSLSSLNFTISSSREDKCIAYTIWSISAAFNNNSSLFWFQFIMSIGTSFKSILTRRFYLRLYKVRCKMIQPPWMWEKGSYISSTLIAFNNWQIIWNCE